MRILLWRFVIWVAEALDRYLLTVPDVDEYYPLPAGPMDSRDDREIERTRPVLRDLIASRAGEAPGFVHE